MQRYAKGQRVHIVSAIDSEGNPKYPDIEAHVGKAGVIIQYYRIGYTTKNAPNDYFVYEIRLDDDNSTMAIAEDALRPLMV
jgi:hypothetical protein